MSKLKRKTQFAQPLNEKENDIQHCDDCRQMSENTIAIIVQYLGNVPT